MLCDVSELRSTKKETGIDELIIKVVFKGLKPVFFGPIKVTLDKQGDLLLGPIMSALDRHCNFSGYTIQYHSEVDDEIVDVGKHPVADDYAIGNDEIWWDKPLQLLLSRIIKKKPSR